MDARFAELASRSARNAGWYTCVLRLSACHNVFPRALTCARAIVSSCHYKSRRLAHTAGHLQLDQAVQLHRVLHGEFLGDRLNEAVHDQRISFGLIQSTAHQVEELVVTDFRDGRLVTDFGLVLFDTNGWIGIGAGILIQQERVTTYARFCVVRTRIDTNQTTIRGSTSSL